MKKNVKNKIEEDAKENIDADPTALNDATMKRDNDEDR